MTDSSIRDQPADWQQERNPLLAGALFLAANGSRVLPLWWIEDGPADTLVCACPKGTNCDSPGKHPYSPAVPNGLDDATLDPELIRHWWTRAPYANIGRVVREDETVLDIDGPEGEAELEKVLAGQQLPATVEVRTGRGRQLLLRKQPGTRATHKWGNHLLLKDFGYVVAAPSFHRAGRYYKLRWPRPPRRADLPPFLLNGQPSQPGRIVVPAIQGSLRDWASELERGFAAGSRNESMWHLAVYLAERRVPRDAAELVMQVAVSRQQPGGSTPPVTWPQARAMLDRAYATRVEVVLHEPSSLFVAGDKFVLDAPEGCPSVWGDDEQKVLWARGQSLMVVAQTGGGKTRVAVAVVYSLLGLTVVEQLGLPVAQDLSVRVLYLACDRPTQIAGLFRLIARPEHREVLAERLVVLPGPPLDDFARKPEALLKLAQDAKATHVVIDSLKDVAVGLAGDEVGASYNKARQLVLAQGIDLLELHAQRKAQSDSKPLKSIDDVYGSMHLKQGAGSVIALDGAPGSRRVTLRHLKQPVDSVGPTVIDIDHEQGLLLDTRHIAIPAAQVGDSQIEQHLARNAGQTRGQIAEALGISTQKAYRLLNDLEERGRAHRRKGRQGGEGGTKADLWYPGPDAAQGGERART